MGETSTVTMVVFVAYILGVFALAAISHQYLSKRSFLSEYFLGSRGLGMWALAFSFAATSASGGSFGGYPSLIYSHGWVLAFWISSYMIVPLVTMGVMGKRLNQVARKTGAITIPDVLRDRYESRTVGLLATCTIIFFSICFMVAQFKLGALIIEDTFNLDFSYAYEVSLVVFAFTVIFYTAYGGFRAVVWTDVMQGIVMGIGVVILVPIVIVKTGGLHSATESLIKQPPTAVTSVPGPRNAKGTFNDLVFQAVGSPVPDGLRYVRSNEPNASLTITWPQMDEARQLINIRLATDQNGETTSTGNDIKQAIEEHAQLGSIIDVDFPYKNDDKGKGATGAVWFPEGKTAYYFAFLRGDEFIFGPGRKNDGAPWHSLGMIFSFFIMWAIIGMAQPHTMVRLIAFQESKTLKRAIIMVTIYFAMIYLPLVLIMMAARTSLPVLTAEESDRAIVLVATRLVSEMGFGYQILGAIFIAAPFAAVMSTVDSLLLMISSSAVRDVYQRTINPHVSDRVVQRVSYATTALVGILVTVIATRPPDFLQKIIVFVGGGFAAVFLFPTFLGLYWRGMTRWGAIASMIGGFAIILGCFIPPMMGKPRADILGFHPSFWAIIGSGLLAVVVSKLTGPPPQHLVRRYFYRHEDDE